MLPPGTCEYPNNITALQPEFLSTIPRDPVDGQPLRYHRNADGSYVLYSVGEDGRDDNGDPMPTDGSKKSLAWETGRDWVSAAAGDSGRDRNLLPGEGKEAFTLELTAERFRQFHGRSLSCRRHEPAH